ncbi:MAG TPA: GTPase [Candidatus Nanoarchaeia archaeon]|nr:GTPase [Candidatus Nanoarchaeia archaeon]
MPSFWKHVNEVLREAEIIIEVLDARMIDETRNKEVEDKVRLYGKRLLYVLTKCDLVQKEQIEPVKKTLVPSVFVSSKDHLGTTILKKKILEMSRGKSVTVGVVGYPNVGKSSLINALAGRRAAKTSPESSYTKGIQKIRVDSKILLLDSPGVFPSMEKDRNKHGKTGAVDHSKIKDPETAALNLINDEKNLIKKYYDLKSNDIEQILEELAIKFRKLEKGGKPNIEVAARFLLKEWQRGKIRIF